VSGFGNFLQSVPDAVRRALLELKRSSVQKTGDTMTGVLRVNEVIQAGPTTATEGGEVQLLPGTSGSVNWSIDNASDLFRIHEGGWGHVTIHPTTNQMTLSGGLVVENNATASNPTGVSVPESGHATSNRAKIDLGTWQLGQDINTNGTRDWFLYNGATGFAITIDVDNTIAQLGKGYASYTPQVWQGAGTPNISKTISHAIWNRLGQIVFVQVQVSMTGAGTAGQLVNIQLPFAPSVGGILGTMEIDDSSTGVRYVGAAEYNTSGGIHGAIFVSSATAFNGWGGNPNLALASGDAIKLNLAYRIA
jgi:hypothetical protein